MTAIETRWPEQRERRVEAASRRLGGDLHAGLAPADRLAQAAPGRAARRSGRRARGRSNGWCRRAGTEMSVVRARSARAIRGPGPAATVSPPVAEGDSIGARATGYYVVLEARRHSDRRPHRRGRRADLGPSRRSPTALAVSPSGSASAPRSGSRSTLPAPRRTAWTSSTTKSRPPRGAGCSSAFSRSRRSRAPPSSACSTGGSRRSRWLVLLIAAVADALASPRPLSSASRFLRHSCGSRCAPRSVARSGSSRSSLRPPSSARLLGPLSGSAGVLALAGTLLTIAGVWLWRRRLRAAGTASPSASLLLLASPYLISSLGRGITPPAGGVSVRLWLSWQLRHPGLRHGADPAHGGALPWRPMPRTPRWRGSRCGVAIALAAAIDRRAGLEPARRVAGLVHVPVDAGAAPRRAARPAVGRDQRHRPGGRQLRRRSLPGVPSSAGRSRSPQRDVARLGDEPDPLAVPLLERFGEQVMDAPAPTSASEMYALWRGSALGDQGYPAQLALWTSDGALIDELALDSLDLPPSLLSTMVRELDPDDVAAGRAGRARAGSALRPPGAAGARMRCMTAASRPPVAAGDARSGGPPAATRPSRVAALPAHTFTAGRIRPPSFPARAGAGRAG